MERMEEWNRNGMEEFKYIIEYPFEESCTLSTKIYRKGRKERKIRTLAL